MYRTLLLLACCCLVLSVTGYSQRTPPENLKVLGISVEGLRPGSGTDEGAIIANKGLKVGDVVAIPGDRIRTAIQRLWGLRIFSDIQILAENRVQDGAYIVVKVEEYPRVRAVEIVGTDDVDEDDVRKKVSLVDGQILTQDDRTRIVKAVLRAAQGDKAVKGA